MPLDVIKPGAQSKRPKFITISGPAGSGKTTLASSFPRPLFIKAEDGLPDYNPQWEQANLPIPDSLPLVGTVDDLWQQLTDVAREDHDYKTLVIDSVTRLEEMFIDYALKAYNAEQKQQNRKQADSIQTSHGGYGAGRAAVAALHARVRNAAEYILRNRMMNVVFLAHADVESIDLPDKDPFMRYNTKLHKRSTPPYIDNVDCVAFLAQKTFIDIEKDQKIGKAKGDIEKVIICHEVASSVSKNRFGINQEIPFKIGVNPFKDFIAD